LIETLKNLNLKDLIQNAKPGLKKAQEFGRAKTQEVAKQVSKVSKTAKEKLEGVIEGKVPETKPKKLKLK